MRYCEGAMAAMFPSVEWTRARLRVAYVTLALATIVIGLTVHWHGAQLRPAARDWVGDALWAAMVAWWMGAFVPNAKWTTRSGVALGLCFAVELSQLYHAPWLDAARRTAVGHLVLGSGFDLCDLSAYTLGVLAVTACERFVFRLSR